MNKRTSFTRFHKRGGWPFSTGIIRIRVSVVILMMTFSAAVAGAVAPGKPGQIVVHADKPTGAVIRPVWTKTNIWDLEGTPETSRSPQIREIILMTATGGRDTCEMVGIDEEGQLIFSFEKLTTSLDKILQLNLIPTVVIGNMPEALSSIPQDRGGFNANVGKPKDYSLYYDYLSNLFSHLAKRYGPQTVTSWNWRLMTEPDNKSWWAYDLNEYKKLYDYTVAAARESLPDIIIDGGNLMILPPEPSWLKQWVDWIASNDSPGRHPDALPRKIQTVSFSCYGAVLGATNTAHIGADPRNLADIARTFHSVCQRRQKVKLEVAEGQILFDENNKYLWLGDGTELGAAWNAAIFKICLDEDIERFVQWGWAGLTPQGDVKSPVHHVISIYETLLNSHRIETDVSLAAPVNQASYVDALSSRDSSGNVRLVVFHYNQHRNLELDYQLKITIQGLTPATYQVRHWRVDKEHSNFFSKWLDDSKDIRRIDSGAGSGSVWDLAIYNVLDEEGKKFWDERKSSYLENDDLEQVGQPQKKYIAGQISRDIIMPANSVSLLEFIREE